MSKSYSQHPVDANGWTDWVQPMPAGYRVCCCDCGLVHEMDFRYHDGKVQFRARRHTRATASVRAHAKRETP